MCGIAGVFAYDLQAPIVDRSEHNRTKLNSRHALQATAGQLTGGHFKVSALEAIHYMRNQLLRDTDWASMSASLEVRVQWTGDYRTP